MKFINIAALLMGAYSVVSVATFMLTQTLSPGRDTFKLWDDPYNWRYLPDGGLRQMAAPLLKDDYASTTYGSEIQSVQSSSASSANRTMMQGRFPAYGTREFRDRCIWTTSAAAAHVHGRGADCTFLVRPKQGDENREENMATWVTQIVEGYILARQAGCRLLLDYGPGVDIHQVLRPAPDLLGTDFDDQLHNWTVPDGFSCAQDSRCFTLPLSFMEPILPGRRPLASVPFYRFKLWGTGGRRAFYDKMNRDLEQTLPGFQIEYGMACTLGKLLHLAPGASQFEPGLFTDLLPKMRHEGSLVITMYIRESQTSPSNTVNASGIVDDLVNQALAMEEKYLVGAIEPARRDIRSIVWMVVTDFSTHLTLLETYGGKDANAKVSADKQKKWPSREIPREIISLAGSSRDKKARVHSQQNQATIDFAESFIDWYLIGESDVALLPVENQNHRLERIGAFRTARPPYNNRNAILKLFDRGKAPVGKSIVVQATAGKGAVIIGGNRGK